MTAIEDRTAITAEIAFNLEAEFLGGLEDAQFAYERIVETEAWNLLGFDTFADWWAQRVQPVMRALSMRPTREIAASVVERVREEEAELPPAQRRTQRELADMVGISTKTLQRQSQDRPEGTLSAGTDLGEPEPLAVDEEPPLPGMPVGQEKADAFMAGIDAVEDAAEPAPEFPIRPAPPKWDPEDRKRHEEEVARIRDIKAARDQAQTIVTDVLTAVCVVVAGCRLGETGLVTKEMITKLREAIDQLEGEL